MGFVEMYAAHMAWTVGYGLFALTGGDFAALTVLIVGSSGVAGLVTMFVGLRKYRQEAQAQRVTGSAAAAALQSALDARSLALTRCAGNYEPPGG
jgi:ammonia channel protein AmtB